MLCWGIAGGMAIILNLLLVGMAAGTVAAGTAGCAVVVGMGAAACGMKGLIFAGLAGDDDDNDGAAAAML